MRKETEVLYNAECPICSREVNHYAKLSKKAALPITYNDLGDDKRLADWGVTAEQAARRFHVRRDGEIISGIPAFILLWREIPQFKWLAWLLSLPIIHWTAVKVYDHVAAPILYRMHQRRQAETAAKSPLAR